MDSNVNYVFEEKSGQRISFSSVKREKSLSRSASLAASDPTKLLVLIDSLLDYKTTEIEKKLNVYIENETGAKAVFIGFLQEDELVIRVIGANVLNSECYLSTQNLIYKKLLQTKCSITKNISYLNADLQNLLEEYLVEKIDYYEIVLVPIKSKLKTNKFSIVPAVVHVINSAKSADFTIKIVNDTFKFCLPILLKTIRIEEKTRTKKQSQLLLYAVKKLFCHIGSCSNDALTNIAVETRKLMNAEKCYLFLLDVDGNHLIAMASDGIDNQPVSDIRIPCNEGIEGKVFETGKIINVKNNLQNSFHRNLKNSWTKNILCFPIRDEYGIIGVIRVCNKTIGDFNTFDEEIAVAFSIYCGLCIKHSLIHMKMIKENTQNQFSNRIMVRHMKVNREDVEKVFFCNSKHTFIDFDCFNFLPKKISITETPCQLIKILEDLEIFRTLHIKTNKFIKFVLHIMQGYINAPYHNWMQAFGVAHFGYVLIKKLKLIPKEYLTHLEVFAYILSCLCQGVDQKVSHNLCQFHCENSIEILYKSSNYAIEHSLSQSLRILNVELKILLFKDCNFLECLSSDDYKQFLTQLKTMILASNLSNYFAILDTQKLMLEQGFNIKKKEHKHAFISLMVTCAQFSDQVKEWKEVKIVAQNMFSELCLKCSNNKNIFDKEKYSKKTELQTIPELQIEFLFSTCLPVFLNLSELFPMTRDLVDTIHNNIIHWESFKICQQRKILKESCKSLEYKSNDSSLMNYVSISTLFNKWFTITPITLGKPELTCIFLVYIALFIIVPYYYTL